MVKASLTAACTLCIAAVAGTASAQGFHGATLALEYNDTTSSDYGTYSLEGRLAYDITSNFGVQADFYAFEYSTGGLNAVGFTLHGYFNATPDLTIGLYVGQEQWDFLDGDHQFGGIEALYETSNWSLEGYLGRYHYFQNEETYYGVLTSYHLTDSLELLASAEGWNYPTSATGHYTIGARYTLVNGAFLEGRVGRFESGGPPRDLVSITFGFNLGEGAVFTRRDYVAVTDGW